MPVPVLIDQVFCRNLAYSPEPLRAPRSHPNKIACGDWIPRVSKAINSAAFKHHKTVFHDVHLDHTQRRSRLVCHGVNGEVETHRVGKQAPDLQIMVSSERSRRGSVLARNDQSWWFDRINSSISLLDHGNTACLCSDDPV